MTSAVSPIVIITLLRHICLNVVKSISRERGVSKGAMLTSDIQDPQPDSDATNHRRWASQTLCPPSLLGLGSLASTGFREKLQWLPYAQW